MSCFLFSISDPFIFNMCSKDRSSDHYSCQRHSYGDLREIRQARFLLQVCPWEGAGGRTTSSWKGYLGAMEAPSESAGHTSVTPFSPVPRPVPFGTHLRVPWLVLGLASWSTVLTSASLSLPIPSYLAAGTFSLLLCHLGSGLFVFLSP